MTERRSLLSPAPARPGRAPRAAAGALGLLSFAPALASAQSAPPPAAPRPALPTPAASSAPAGALTPPPTVAAPTAPAPAAPAPPASSSLPPSPGSAPAGSIAPASAGEGQGVVVVAAGDAVDATWPLAASVYGDASLRPKGLHDDAARVLAGETPAPAAPAPVRELAELRSAVRGDDAPSRSVLSTLAQRAGAQVVLVVFAPAGGPVSARPFDPRAGRFEPWTLVPDGLAAPSSRWAAAAGELRRRYGAAPPGRAAVAPASARAAQAPRGEAEKPKRWWSSPWLWGAAGLAALVGVIAVVTSGGGGSEDPPPGARVDIRVDR